MAVLGRTSMIRFLSINQLAVIDTLDMELEPGFTVLTGETGAGKSILVGALGLLLGGRASSDLVRTGETAAHVQAIFERPDGRETIVRREVSAQGRSRAFIDDALATSAALRALGASLVDIHGQHEHQMLLDPKTHLDVLDQFTDLMTARRGVATAFGQLRSLRAAMENCRLDERERADQIDRLRFQLGEIDSVAPKDGEDEELDALRRRLANAEKSSVLCSESLAALYERDGAVLSELAEIWKRVEELARLDLVFAPYMEAREAIKSQLEELAFALRDYGSAIEASPARLQQSEDRLASLERLKKKYGRGSLAGVMSAHAEMVSQLKDLETASTRAGELEQTLNEARQEYLTRAGVLSKKRRKQALALTSALEKRLGELAMEQTRCELRFQDEPSTEEGWTERGTDVAELYLSPNPGEELRPLARIASGGEISRLMLALKTLASLDAPGKTLIFDEVDAGIGGRVAGVVGQRLRELAARFQVVCVTHLPQIAAYATAHFLVSKTVQRRRTVTTAVLLQGEERIDEIARMMTGTETSDRARSSARELLMRGAKTVSEQNTKPRKTSKAKGGRE